MYKFNFNKIRSGEQIYVIAEIGVNHEGSIELAKELIDLAIEGGANAAKFQTYKADKLAIKNSPAYWDLSKESTTSQHELFKKYDSFNENDYVELKEYCDKKGIEFLSTPFDLESVEYLSELMPFFKIASADITNIPLLREVSRYKKPIVLSTGASTVLEIENAVRELQDNGVGEIGLLHCMLNYPTEYENAGLSMIKKLKKLFPDQLIGYSDHTIPDPNMLTISTAISLGANLIEKHFTHNRKLPGNDHYHAMNVDDLKIIINNLELFRLIVKPIDQENRNKELLARVNARRSIVLARKMNKGEVITSADLICKRPALGISPIHWDDVIGKKVLNELDEDHVIQWSEIETVS